METRDFWDLMDEIDARHWLWDVYYGIRRFIVAIPYWIRTHTIDRYHLIDLRKHGKKYVGYKWGWLDVRQAIFIASFMRFQEFVEKEEPFETIVWDDTPEHARVAQEIRELYKWWKEERDLLHHAQEELLQRSEKYAKENGLKGWEGHDANPYWKAWRSDNDDLERQDQEMLERLVKIREHLWT